MIRYNAGRLGINHIFQVQGSVIPKAGFVAMVAGILTSSLSIVINVAGDDMRSYFTLDSDSGYKVYGVFSGFIGFLICFRSNQAYNRFTEGAELLKIATKEWLDACTQLVSFTHLSTKPKEEVSRFQHLIVRLFSMMICAALQSVCDMEDEEFDIIDASILDENSLRLLTNLANAPHDKCEVLFHWIMRIVLQSQQNGLLAVSPPICTRAFQELSNGTLHFETMRCIAETQLPFPYSQVISVLLLLHLPYTVIVMNTLTSNPVLAGTYAAIGVFLVWALTFISTEIEQPFGDDLNDLPVRELQNMINANLLLLLREETQTVPYIPAGNEQQMCSTMTQTMRFSAVIRKKTTMRTESGTERSDESRWMSGLSQRSTSDASKSTSHVSQRSSRADVQTGAVFPLIASSDVALVPTRSESNSQQGKVPQQPTALMQMHAHGGPEDMSMAAAPKIPASSTYDPFSEPQDSVALLSPLSNYFQETSSRIEKLLQQISNDTESMSMQIRSAHCRNAPPRESQVMVTEPCNSC